MNFPTNKLRDVVLTLQSFDPDLQVNLENVNLTHDGAGRRILMFTTKEISQLTETNNKYAQLLTEQEQQLDELRAKLSDLARGLNEITFAVRQIEVQLAANIDNIEQSLAED